MNCGQAVHPPTNADRARHVALTRIAPAMLAEKARTAVTGERRPVTALFADVVGSTTLAEALDPEEWTAIMNRAFDLMSRTAYRYEGTIAGLWGDEMLAFFGAPVAHEDDPERAVRAALDMLAAVEEYGGELRSSHGIEFQIRVGINTGPVVVGNVGSDLKYEYTAMGDAINVASRMKSAAKPGAVNIGEATYRFVSTAFECLDLGPLLVKGKSEPVRTYEVLGMKTQPGPRRGIAGLYSPMVGREVEFAGLRQITEDIQGGSGRVVVISGEPGVGKTRLVAEWRDAAVRAAPQLRWIEGHCVSYDRNLPYHLVIDVLRSTVGVPAASAEPEAQALLRAQVQDLLGESGSEHYEVLAHLMALPLDAPAQQRLSELDASALQARYIAALQQVIAALGRRGPTVLVGEDIHWIDSPSADVLRRLLPLVQEHPVLIALVLRPDQDTTGWTLLTAIREQAGDRLTEIVLNPLTAEDSQRLLANLLVIESLPPTLRELILGRTEGNPFFLEEVIRALIDRGAIERSGDVWMARHDAVDLDMPDTLEGLLRSRIDRLPAEARHALQVAAVIGREFPVEVLEQVLRAEDLMPSARKMDVLEAAALIRVVAVEPEVTYGFRHALIQEAGFESLLKQDRRRLHQAVAEALQRLYPGRQADLAGELARHFESAGDSKRALEFLVLAGRHALGRFAPREARAFLERAEQYLPADAEDAGIRRQRVETRLLMIEAGYTFVPADQDLRLIEEILPLAEALGDPHLLARNHYWIAQIRQWRGEMPPSPEQQRSLRLALELGTQVGDDGLRAMPLSIFGAMAFKTADYANAIAALDEAVRLLAKRGNLAGAAANAAMLALAYAVTGEFARLDEIAQRALEWANQSGDPNAKVDTELFVGRAMAERGHLEDGLSYMRNSVARAEQIGNTLCAAVGHFFMAEHYMRTGQPDLALPALDKGIQLGEFCNIGPNVRLGHALKRLARLTPGNAAAARAAWDAAFTAAEELGDRLTTGELHHNRALAMSMQPDAPWDMIQADFVGSIATFEALGAKPYLARALRDYGLALQRHGAEARAQEYLRRADALFETLNLPATA